VLTPDPSSRYNSTDPAVLVARDVRTGDVVHLRDGVDFDSPLAWSR
jgi:hypothetical protein